MNKFKKNDSVKVISGSYKGQTGRVLKIITKNNRVLVEGINKVKKHMKPSQDNPQGGIVEKDMSIHESNLMLLDKSKPVKVGFKVLESGKRVRINKKNGNTIK
jgi:large subunit ribosomal protein L24